MRVMMMMILQVQKVMKVQQQRKVPTLEQLKKLQQLVPHRRLQPLEPHKKQQQLLNQHKSPQLNLAKHLHQVNQQLLIVTKITKLQFKMITILVVFLLLNHVMQHDLLVNQVDAAMSETHQAHFLIIVSLNSALKMHSMYKSSKQLVINNKLNFTIKYPVQKHVNKQLLIN